MRVLKNLLGDGSKIHGDSVHYESGSNDDGYWVKLPDGRYFCQKELPPAGLTVEDNGIWDSGISIWNFPINFNEKPLLWASAGHENRWANGRAMGTASAQFRSFSNRTSGGAYPLFGFAIGR